MSDAMSEKADVDDQTYGLALFLAGLETLEAQIGNLWKDGQPAIEALNAMNDAVLNTDSMKAAIKQMEAIAYPIGLPGITAAAMGRARREITRISNQPSSNPLAVVAPTNVAARREHISQASLDPFAIQDRRQEAVSRAAADLGAAKHVAHRCKVDYSDLRKWVRARHGHFAKGPSQKAERIERTLLPYLSS